MLRLKPLRHTDLLRAVVMTLAIAVYCSVASASPYVFGKDPKKEAKTAKTTKTAKPDISEAPDLELKIKAYQGYTRFVDEYGDTCRMTYIREIVVYPPLKFKNKKQEEFYWRTVRDVRKTLPYAKLAFSTLCETYEYIQTIPDKKQREAHLKRLEKDIFEKYKPAVKRMTKRQGKVMLKLINRETDQTGFSIVKAFLGTFRAGFWQTFGRFFGVNMRAGFHPDKNEEDAIIERVATLIEQGAL